MKRAPRWKTLDGPMVGYAVGEEELRGAASTLGARLVKTYSDPAVAITAPLPERPGLVDALVAVEIQGAAALLVASPSHLGGGLAWAAVEALVERHGAVLLALEGREPRDEDLIEVSLGDAKAVLLDVHRLARAAEIRAGHERRAREGKRNSRYPAYGYKLAEDGETLLEVPEERRAVERMLALRGEGLSYAKIASALDLEGVPTRKGRPWAATTVRQVIQRGGSEG